MMMFYEAAGGRSYTGLSDDYQRFVDFSGLLKTGRAVLVARPPRPCAMPAAAPPGATAAAPIGHAPGDRHAVVYRFVLPGEEEGMKAR